ncbi:hypothetical protein [Streptomyces cinereospinus]|uniref:Uncharacterized protein n=1 Tax=Streptomyces cinereospinus TaxID=285561 RepID=A0ABV5MZ85_9ACTN
MTNHPTAPAGLRGRGRDLYETLTEALEFTPAEHATLTEACRTATLLDDLQEAMDGAPFTVLGSQRQPVANPLLTELRSHRLALVRLLAALDLPDLEDDDGEGPVYRSVSSIRAQRAAKARWSGHTKRADLRREGGQ